MRRDPLENCTVDIGTSVDRHGKVWVRFVFREPGGKERAYAYDAEAASGLLNALTVAARIAESSNPSN
jgi:hypothetical protein